MANVAFILADLFEDSEFTEPWQRTRDIEEFILSGYPHLEEAWWFGEGVLPLLRRRGLWTRPDLVDQRTSRTAAYAALHGS